MKIKANYLIRNNDADEIDENGNKRYAVEYCLKDYINDDLIECGFDYDYFDTEEEANEFIKKFNDKAKGLIEVGTTLYFDIYKNFKNYEKKETMLKVEYLGQYLDKGISSLTARFIVLDYGTQCPKYKKDIISLPVCNEDLYDLNYQLILNESTKKLKPKFINMKDLSQEEIEKLVLD